MNQELARKYKIATKAMPIEQAEFLKAAADQIEKLELELQAVYDMASHLMSGVEFATKSKLWLERHSAFSAEVNYRQAERLR